MGGPATKKVCVCVCVCACVCVCVCVCVAFMEFLRRFKWDLARSLPFLRNELGATLGVLKTGASGVAGMCPRSYLENCSRILDRGCCVLCV